MIRLGLILALLLLLAACGSDQIHRRYRAERELWRVDQLRLELPRGRAGRQPMAALAERYERIGRRFELDAVQDSVDASIQRVAGRAWLSAVEMHLERLDSLRATVLLDSIRIRFVDVPEIAAEAAWRRGRIARHDRDPELALNHFRWVVDQIDPDPGAEGVEDSVLHLPLEMLRLARPYRTETELEQMGEWSHDYYVRHLQADSVDVRTDSRWLLAQVDFERQHWAEAIEQLEALEHELLRWTENEREFPRYEPALVRLRRFEATVEAWQETKADLSSLEAQFQRLREEYEDYGIAAQALWWMARAARDRGLSEAALQLFSRLRVNYDDPDVLPEAMLARARLLERVGEWRQAYVNYQLLYTEYPLSRSGLRAHLEIADHHRRRQDPVSAHQALLRAEAHYLGVLDRYPDGPHAVVVTELLIEALERLGRYDEALDYTLALSRRFAGRPRELRLLRTAALLAKDELENPTRFGSILDRIVQDYPSTHIGVWASRERERLGVPPTGS